MVRALSDGPPGFELKHRILGAIILISTAVIVIPLILGNPQASAPRAYPEVSSSEGEDSVFVSRITPVGEQQQPAVAPEPEGTPVLVNTSRPQASAGRSEPPAKPAANMMPLPEAEPAEEAAEQAEPGTTKQAEPKPAVAEAREPKQQAQPEVRTDATDSATQAVASADERGWIVRIGTFSKLENAKRLASLLQQKGFEPVSRDVQTESGSVTRVWVGPFTTRVEAARVQTRIQEAIGEEGLITAYP